MVSSPLNQLTFNSLNSRQKLHLCDYLFKYCNDEFSRAAGWKKQAFYKNAKPYGALETKEIYARAVLDYIAGMTDRFAVKCFDELITY